MPFIDSKITMKLSQEKKEILKSELGKAVSTLNKSESFLMVGIQDDYELYLGGKKLEEGAYVEVSLLGNASKESYNKMTATICEIYEKEFHIPKSAIYITYHGINDWGWNGRNF